jgi:zinc/manganese transport system substrate-binding protein
VCTGGPPVPPPVGWRSVVLLDCEPRRRDFGGGVLFNAIRLHLRFGCGKLFRMKQVVAVVMACLAGLLAFGRAEAAALRVSALHPLMADLARQVGGDQVEVFDLVGEGGNPHRFEPRPGDLKQLRASALILASGKGLEPYLDRVKATLGGVPVVEVGRTIPSLSVGKDAVYTCCPDHATGSSLDPHWWQGVENMRRAARVVAQEFGAKDPGRKDLYLANAAAYGKRLDGLKRWARQELAKVPQRQRKLVTAHNAFGYFAKEFGFQVIAVAGLNKEQNTTPQQQAATIASVRQAGVQAVFPEIGASGKAVDAVAKAAGVRVAEPLIADGNGHGADAGFEGMIRHNVRVITAALSAP